MDGRSTAVGSRPHCWPSTICVGLPRAGHGREQGRAGTDPGALEALLLAPVGVDAPRPRNSAHLQDRLRRREAALRAVLEGLPDATVAAGATGGSSSPTRTPRRCSDTNTTSCSASRCRSLWPERLRDRYTRNMELYFATDHPLRFTIRADGLRRDGTEFVGEMSWGIVETEAGPAAARDRARHDRAPRGDGAAAAPVAPGGGGRRAGRARAGGRRRRRPRRRGGRADARDAAAAARARSSATARTLAAWGTGSGDDALRFEIRTGDEVFGEVCAVVEGDARRGRGELPARRSPTCSRPRWGGCAARSRCATRRCTTR